jgi:hypothetical protein
MCLKKGSWDSVVENRPNQIVRLKKRVFHVEFNERNIYTMTVFIGMYLYLIYKIYIYMNIYEVPISKRKMFVRDHTRK